MKKISILLLSACILLGVSSCSKTAEDDANSTQIGTGQVSLAFGFDGSNEESKTRAVTSSAIPTTTWAKNIKSMSIIIAESETGIIRSVYNVASANLPTDAGTPAPTSPKYTIQGIPTGTYHAYVVANYDQTSSPFATVAGVAPSTPINGSLVSSNISSLLFTLNALSTGIVGTDPAGAELKGQPSEIFVAKTTATFNITADVNTDLTSTPLKLTRSVSLMRVRVNKTATINQGVDFTDASTVVRVRRHAQSLKMVGGTVFGAMSKEQQVLYMQGPLSTTNTPADYSAAIGVSPTDYHAWRDYLVFPGGSTSTSADKYNIVIGAMAPVGYVPAATTSNPNPAPISAKTMVYWQGAVSSAFAANKIIVINMEITTAGVTEIENPLTYGNLDIKVDLVDWDTNVENFHMPL